MALRDADPIHAPSNDDDADMTPDDVPAVVDPLEFPGLVGPITVVMRREMQADRLTLTTKNSALSHNDRAALDRQRRCHRATEEAEKAVASPLFPAKKRRCTPEPEGGNDGAV